MEGLTLYVYELANMEQLLEQDGVPVIDSGGIIFNEEYRVFGKPCPQNIIRSCLISPQLAENGLYWDLLIQSSSMPSGWKRTSWDDYRTKAISWACYVYEPYPLEGWADTAKLPKQPLSITYDAPEEEFISTPRRGFKEHISRIFNFPDNKACCHRVSYKTIENILLATFNFLKSGEIEQDIMNYILDLLKDCFYRGGEPDQFSDPYEYQNYTELKNAIEILKGTTQEFLEEPENCTTVGKTLNQVLNCLNNAMSNLREGYASWNCSIGEKFDPERWEVVVQFEEGNYKILTEEGLIDPVEDPKEEGVYLTSEDDGVFIDMLKQIEALLGILIFKFDFPRYGEWRQRQFIKYPGIRSSKNKFPLYRCYSQVCFTGYYYWNPRLRNWCNLNDAVQVDPNDLSLNN